MWLVSNLNYMYCHKKLRDERDLAIPEFRSTRLRDYHLQQPLYGVSLDLMLRKNEETR